MNLKDKRIFVIEDKPDNYAIIKLMLEPYEVVVWFDRWGRDTIERLGKFMPVDLILLDLMFPGDLTGYQLFRQIREHDEFDAIPIVAVSASDPTTAIAKTRACGFAGFIPKPLDDERFPQQIDQILNGAGIWAER